ncbi:GGDEF domain-containing protein [Photobacterium sp. SDRW27]|uniref:GGDEF domain-containing protein n=1 Tax=Photobacterium obscurum TaxID=2829490 RepID=UPI0022434F76|nr:GGDEF domain-containing protein [Photobacterium obscurum]MCW8327911.1 GGDEF domain-containing protein [Photobacterium obscurum]
MITQYLRITTYFLISFTVASYLWYHLGGANKEFVITFQNATFKNIDDTSQGGTTKSKIDYDNNSLTLSCSIENTARWPFCEVAIELTEGIKGIDLSQYHSIGLDIDYDSAVSNERVRVYLRNYDPAYSDKNDPVSSKFNAIEFAPGRGNGLHVIPMQAFQVLSWWIADYKVPIEQSGPQFDNVTIIEVATGSNVKSGSYTIKLNKVVFFGDWVSESALLRLNILLWMITAITFLGLERWRLRCNLKVVEQRTKQLRTANQKLYKKSLAFEALAFKDPLTGTKNRRAVESWLHDILEYSRDNNQPFSLLYLDIDHFKLINDSYGHHKGDEILQEFAKLVNQRIRKSDVFVRWGGEEFIIFCPGTALLGAMGLGELLRSITENYLWCDDLVITCSIGVAELEGSESFESLIQRADSALYKAKKYGRNRVEA